MDAWTDTASGLSGVATVDETAWVTLSKTLLTDFFARSTGVLSSELISESGESKCLGRQGMDAAVSR